MNMHHKVIKYLYPSSSLNHFYLDNCYSVEKKKTTKHKINIDFMQKNYKKIRNFNLVDMK